MASSFTSTTRSLARETSTVAIIAWAACAVLLCVWLGWFFLSRVTVYEVSRSARLEVQQSAHPVASVMAGKLVSTSMVLGQEVREGDVLVQLDASAEQARLAEEDARLTALAPRIESLQREITALEQARQQDQLALAAAVQAAGFRAQEATAALDFARDSERRLKEDSALGGSSQAEAARAAAEARKLAANRDAMAADTRRLEAEARNRAQTQQAQIENLQRTALTLRGEQATSRTAMLRLRQEMERMLIRAPVSGTLADVPPLRAGGFVAQGQKLGTVVPRGAMVIVAEFTPAAVLGRIRPGQTGHLRLDGFPWAEFGTIEARVTRVASEIRDQLVRVEFTPEPAAGNRIPLQHGLPGSLEVAIEQASPAVLLLRAAGQWSSGLRAPAATANAAP